MRYIFIIVAALLVLIGAGTIRAQGGVNEDVLAALALISTGQLDYHLHELQHIGVVEQQGRNRYALVLKHIVPLLTALPIAHDLGSKTSTERA
jgi:hypothetical protein